MPTPFVENVLPREVKERSGEQENRALLVGITSSWGRHVRELAHGRIHIEFVAQHLKPQDVAARAQRDAAVVIVDLACSPAKGIETVLACRHASKRAPVIVIADKLSAELARAISRIDIVRLAFHPVTTVQLRSAIDEALRIGRNERLRTVDRQ